MRRVVTPQQGIAVATSGRAALRRQRRRRRRLFAAAAASALLAGALWSAVLGSRQDLPVAAPSPAAASVQELVLHPSASFVESVGVNVHWSFLDTPYATRYEEVRDLLVDSGIRHVRGEVTRAEELAALGVRTTVLVDLDADDQGDPRALVADLADLAQSGAVVAVEGPNEGDLFWVDRGRSYRGMSFPEGVLAWQRELWEAVHADPRTSGLTVIGPSLGGTFWGGENPFPAGSLEKLTDWGNIHPYAAGNPYADTYRYAGIDDYYRESDFPSVALDRFPITLTTYRPPFGDRPMAATEAGWSTWRLGQSERTQAAYLPRLFLECFRLRLQRCYAYEFVDEFEDADGEEREANFGMVRNDLTLKPSYVAVRSLMRAVSDPTGSAGKKASTLGATITVDPPDGFDAEALHHVALVKDDGTVVIALWHEVSGNDLEGLDEEPPRPIREVIQPPVPVVLELGDRTAQARVEVIDEGGELVDAPARRTGSSVSISVPDRVTLVTLPPGASA